MNLFKYFLQVNFLFLLRIFARADFPESDLILSAGDDVCASVNCGQGTCKAANTFIGYECECNSGWKRVEIGTFAFPHCVVPNCTINYDCGAQSCHSPSSSPPPPRVVSQLSNPCSLAWCGAGTCVRNGTDYSCKCHSDSTNLLNLTNLPCLKSCSFGQDCPAQNLGPNLPGQPPSPDPVVSQPGHPPGSPSPKSSNDGSAKVPNGSFVVLMVLTFLTTHFVL